MNFGFVRKEGGAEDVDMWCR